MPPVVLLAPRLEPVALQPQVAPGEPARQHAHEHTDGPSLIEALTYRLSGHSTSDDPKAYRPEPWIEPWRKLDPLDRLRRYLVKQGATSEAKDKEIEAEVDAEVKAAVAAAEKTEAPSLASMFDEVYAELPWHLEEQKQELLAGPRAKGH